VPVVHMKSLLEAGVHFGHRTRRWNPKMKPYIFTERNGIHIIDLQQTMGSIEKSYNLVRDFVAQGGSVLLTGTKKQAQDTIAFESERCGMPYVNQRWLGGTLTNFRTMRQRIEKLAEMEGQRERGEFSRLTKKEALEAEGEIAKLMRRFGGMRDIRRLPDVLYVTDVRREALAVKEANILKIPVIALVDTNCDPDPVNYVIPANDDAIRAIKLITSKIADAVIEGKEIRAVTVGAREQEEDEREDERYLGPATLAKLQLGGDTGDENAADEKGPWVDEEEEDTWVVPDAEETTN
jgi:small subunit ribosomal protein S2